MKNKTNRIAMIAVITGVAIVAAIFIVPFLSSAGTDVDTGSANDTQQAQAENAPASGNGSSEVTAANKIKVTFIELGSVKCIPCKMMQPVMKKVEETYPDSVKVVFYDVWTEKDKARAVEYNINAIPTQVFLDRDGNEYYRHVGFFPFEELEKILKQKL